MYPVDKGLKHGPEDYGLALAHFKRMYPVDKGLKRKRIFKVWRIWYNFKRMYPVDKGLKLDYIVDPKTVGQL